MPDAPARRRRVSGSPARRCYSTTDRPTTAAATRPSRATPAAASSAPTRSISTLILLRRHPNPEQRSRAGSTSNSAALRRVPERPANSVALASSTLPSEAEIRHAASKMAPASRQPKRPSARPAKPTHPPDFQPRHHGEVCLALDRLSSASAFFITWRAPTTGNWAHPVFRPSVDASASSCTSVTPGSDFDEAMHQHHARVGTFK